jgi:hypothetical protein
VISQEVNQPSWEWSTTTSITTLVSDSYTANNLDRYSSISGTAATYDANGNLDLPRFYSSPLIAYFALMEINHGTNTYG